MTLDFGCTVERRPLPIEAMKSSRNQPRIGFFSYSLNLGGMETFLLTLGSFLRDRGMNVSFLLTDSPGNGVEAFRRAGLEVSVFAPSYRAFPLYVFLHCLRVRLLLRKQEFDAVFLNHSRYAQQALEFLPRRTLRYPVVHNDFQPVYDVALANPNAWDAVVAVSRKTYDRAVERVGQDRVVLIPYGVRVPSNSEKLKRSGPSNPLRLLYCGRLEQAQKNIFILPEVLARLKDSGTPCDLTLAGDGPDRPELVRRISERGVAHLCTFLGPVRHERVYEHLLEHHVLLLPSSFEGLPLILLEAQACGCVPIARALEGVTTFATVPRETAILVPELKAEAFAAAVKWLQRDHSYWSKLSQAGMAFVAERFSVERMGSRYLELITRRPGHPRQYMRHHTSPSPRLFNLADVKPSQDSWSGRVYHRLSRRN
jgi:glycosyltransferase involved in cell wall biosynthesis